MQVPYKLHYSLGEFWDTLTQGTLWKAYAKANPGEAAALTLHVHRKLNGEPDSIAGGITNTFTGDALLMILLTLQP